MSFPTKEERELCWGHRDVYWKCLDEGKSEEDCKSLKENFLKYCPVEWVKHFERKRNYLKYKEQIEKGYVNDIEIPAMFKKPK